ncbi:MAG: hypothetical protein IJO38_09465 [Akkermansia sp.]|nr:hypothetical protein [Akkermansia sp.]
MKLEDSAWYFKDAARRMVKNHPELLRRVGVAVLNVAMQRTPPNRGAAEHPGKKDVGALNRRIEMEILGGTGKTVPGWDFKKKKVVGPCDSWGAYAFRVPVNAGKAPIRYTDPMKILAQRRFRRVRNVVRAWAGEHFDDPNWVRRADLLSAVKRVQERSGSLIGGWYPAAAALQAGNASRDFHPGKQRRAGRVKLATADVVSELEMVSDWGDLLVARRFKGKFGTHVRTAAQGAVRNTENWFLKQTFG